MKMRIECEFFVTRGLLLHSVSKNLDSDFHGIPLILSEIQGQDLRLQHCVVRRSSPSENSW